MTRKFLTRPYLLLLFGLTIIFLSPQQSKASHTWGFELTYECLSNCSVRVYLRGIRHCAGAANAISFGGVTIAPSNPNCPSLTPLGPISQLTTWDVTPICPSVLSECDSISSQFTGVEYHEYYRDYSYCGNNSGCDYTFEYQSCCRTYASTVFENNSLGWALNLELKTGQPTCNSSPIYNTDWEVMVPQNHFVRDLGGIDPDGDSLSYELTSCLRSPSQLSIYKPGFSFQSPLGPHATFDLDPVTGNLYGTFNSQANFSTFFCVKITEWRNGNIVGETTRDLLLIPMIFSNNQLPQFGGYTNVTGGAELGLDQFSVCLGSTLSFDIPTSDPDSASTLKLWWNQHIPNASFTDAQNNLAVDTVTGQSPTGRFQFTPTATGIYYFQTRLEDNACPFTGAQEKTIAIRVINSPFLSAQLEPCNEVNFSAYTCGTAPLTYQWSGDAGLTGTGNQAHIIYPQPGTYTFQCIVTDANQNQVTLIDSVTVPHVLAQPAIDGLDTITGCQGVSLQVNALAGFTNHQWSNGFTSSFSNTTTPGWLYLEADLPSGCRVRDSIYVQFTPPGYAQIIQPIGQPTIDQCNGMTSATLNATGNYTNYGWSNGAGTAQTTVTQPGTYHITATTTDGCTEYDSIEIGFIPPDIYGQIRAYNNAVMVNQKVYLIKYNTNSQLLERVDSASTDQDGNYFFCNLNSTAAYYVQTHPDPLAYPGQLPTYGDGVMVWNETSPLYPSTLGPQQADINTLPQFATGGSGSIGGRVLSSQSGNPVEGLRVFLVLNNQAIIDYRDTDANGDFSFGTLPTGNYKLVPDRPFVDHIAVPQLVLSNSVPSQDSLDLKLHPTFLELVTPTSSQLPFPVFKFSVAPNPVQQSTTLSLDLPEEDLVKVEVFDIRGTSLGTIWDGPLPAGTWKQLWEPQLAQGMYFLRVSLGAHQEIHKILIQ